MDRNEIVVTVIDYWTAWFRVWNEWLESVNGVSPRT